MTDQPRFQPEEAQTPPTNADGNGSQPPSHATDSPKSSKAEPIEPRSKSTGPRTPQGKERSKFNARKHGLFSKVVLLHGESRAEYDALLNRLMEDLCPQGKLETVLVENLATLMWRKRRLLQAETAEIEKARFLRIDLALEREVDNLEYAQLRDSSGARLGQSNPLTVLRNAIQILDMYRLIVLAGESESGEAIRQKLKTIHGYEKGGPAPYSWRQTMLMVAKLQSSADQEKQDSKEPPDLQQITAKAILEEITRLSKLHDTAATVEALKRENTPAATRISSQEVSERLVRYEAHLSREIDRILNRLERLQRMRKGQPVAAQVDVNMF